MIFDLKTSSFYSSMHWRSINIRVYLEKTKQPCLTLYFPMFPFDPPENIRKPKVFGCFRGDQKGTLGSKGLICQHKHLGISVLANKSLNYRDKDAATIRKYCHQHSHTNKTP